MLSAGLGEEPAEVDRPGA